MVLARVLDWLQARGSDVKQLPGGANPHPVCSLTGAQILLVRISES